MKQMKRALALLLALALCQGCFTAPVAAVGDPAAKPVWGAVDLSPEEPVRVLVRLEGNPAPAGDPIRGGLSALERNVQHSAFRRCLTQRGWASGEMTEYRTLFNGFALTLARGDLEALAAMPEVAEVLPAVRREPPRGTLEGAAGTLAAGAGDESSWQGSGALIALLDTGLTPDHEAFACLPGMLETPKLTQTAAQGGIEALGRGVWRSQKIPFAWDYADGDADPADPEGAGTAAAALAAGLARTREGVRFRGAAPDAQLLAMKIYSSQDGTTDTALCLQALEDACLLGADVVVLNLGAAVDAAWEGLDQPIFEEAIHALRARGVAVVVPAGDRGSMAAGASNQAGSGYVTGDYADYGLITGPAACGDSLTVASAESDAYALHCIQAGDRLLPLYDGGDRFYLTFAGSETLSYAVIPGDGAPEDWEGLMVQGQIALVVQSGLSPATLAETAQAAGALGLLIAGQDPEAIGKALGETPIPAAALSPEDGAWLAELAELQTFEPEPAAGADSGEDLELVYLRVHTQDELLDGQYLVVSEEAALAFHAGLSPETVNQSGNVLPVEFWHQMIPATEALRAAELQLQRITLVNRDQLYLSCSGQGDDVALTASPENLTVTVSEEGEAQIQCKGAAFRYDGTDNSFRFYQPQSGPYSDPACGVRLYRRGRMPAYLPTALGSFRFSQETAEAHNPAGAKPSDFSALGAAPDLGLKPSLTGSGGHVRTAAAGTAGDYATRSGTGLAAAEVGGKLACLLGMLAQTRPELEAPARLALGIALLESTARVLTDEAGRLVTPRKQGTGLADLSAATTARACLTQPLLSLGDSGEGTYTLRFEIQSLTDEPVTYTVGVYALRDGCLRLEAGTYNSLESWDARGGYRLLGNTLAAVPGGERVPVELTLELTEEFRSQLLTDFPNGGWLDGFVTLTEADPACDGQETCPGRQFTDMPSRKNWAHAGIDFALRRTLFGGTSADTFSPWDTMTRGMMVTVLYALAGRPEPQGENPFRDVKSKDYYYRPVIWASENNIVAGVGDGRFDPKGEITREQMAAILFRYAQYAGLDTEPRASLADFPDAGKTHSYAVEPMGWAVAMGVLSGEKAGDTVWLHPRGAASRAQVATLFMGFVTRCLEQPALNAELHGAFTAFVGDWSQAPVLEAADWRDELEGEPYEVNTGVHGAYALLDGPEGPWERLLGVEPVEGTFQPQRMLLSPTGLTDSLLLRPMLLREARRVVVTATDEATGELYAVHQAEGLPKACWDGETGTWRGTTLRFAGTDLRRDALPEGARVRIDLYASPAGCGDPLADVAPEALGREAGPWLAWSFSFTVDGTAPEVGQVQYTATARTLTFEVTDRRFTAWAALYPAGAENAAPLWQTAFDEAEPGVTHSLTVSGLQAGSYLLRTGDWAGNTAAVSLTLGSGALYQIRFLSPEGCAVHPAETCYAVRNVTVAAPDLTRLPPLGEFLGWMPEPLEGVWTYEQLQDAAFDEEIIPPGGSVWVYNDCAYWTLLRVPTAWAEPEAGLVRYSMDPGGYEGAWAFAGLDSGGGCRFLNSAGGGTACQTEPDPETGNLLLPEPDPALLFQAEAAEGGYYLRTADGTCLGREGETLCFTAQPEAGSLWLLSLDRDTGDARLVSAGSPEELTLVFDRTADDFRLVPRRAVDPAAQSLLLFGPRILEYGYFTAP